VGYVKFTFVIVIIKCHFHIEIRDILQSPFMMMIILIIVMELRVIVIFCASYEFIGYWVLIGLGLVFVFFCVWKRINLLRCNGFLSSLV